MIELELVSKLDSADFEFSLGHAVPKTYTVVVEKECYTIIDFKIEL